MKLPQTIWKKLMLGGMLILLAAAVSLLIKEALDTKAPASAVPTLTVECNGAPLSSDCVFPAAYEWNFLTGPERQTMPNYIPEVILDQAIPASVLPQLPLRFVFSQDTISVSISRSALQGAGDFIAQQPDREGRLFTPTEAGQYIYKIEASFNRGSVVYYFVINVTQMY